MSRYDEIMTMARQEHHHIACSTPGRLSHHKALCYGAEWADKTMIEKATDWLIENFYDHPHEKYVVCSEAFDCVEEMVEEFVKAMKD